MLARRTFLFSNGNLRMLRLLSNNQIISCAIGLCHDQPQFVSERFFTSRTTIPVPKLHFRSPPLPLPLYLQPRKLSQHNKKD